MRKFPLFLESKSWGKIERFSFLFHPNPESLPLHQSYRLSGLTNTLHYWFSVKSLLELRQQLKIFEFLVKQIKIDIMNSSDNSKYLKLNILLHYTWKTLIVWMRGGGRDVISSLHIDLLCIQENILIKMMKKKIM